MGRAPLQPADPARIGRYRLVARLGAGGMGVVYLAEARDGQPVAVKVLRPELADNPEFRTRFGREVTTLTRVRGMCTVRVIEADTQAPKPFLVTEYADGPSLAEYVDAHGPLDQGMLYGLATGLAEALAAIHAAGGGRRSVPGRPTPSCTGSCTPPPTSARCRRACARWSRRPWPRTRRPGPPRRSCWPG